MYPMSFLGGESLQVASGQVGSSQQAQLSAAPDRSAVLYPIWMAPILFSMVNIFHAGHQKDGGNTPVSPSVTGQALRLEEGFSVRRGFMLVKGHFPHKSRNLFINSHKAVKFPNYICF